MKLMRIAASILAGSVLLTGCTATPTPTPTPSPTPEPKPTLSNYFTLTDNNQPFPYVGVGSQYNGGLYSQLSQYAYGFNQSNYEQAETLIKSMGSQYIRIFYDSAPTKVATGDNPYSYPKDTADRASFRKVVELAHNTPNASINITHWHGPYTIPATNTQGTTDIKVPFAVPEMEAFANELDYLITERGFTSVKYITIQNEANTAGMAPTVPEALALYEKLVRSLDYYLTQKGIRDQVQFVCEVTGENDSRMQWISYWTNEINDLVQGFSHHYYWHFTDSVTFNNFQSRLSNLAILMNFQMNTLSADKRKPVYIAEYGVRGYTGADNATEHPDQPGVSAPNNPDALSVTEMTLSAWQLANFQIAGINLGVVGFAKWDGFRAKYDGGFQDHSSINPPSDDFALRPLYYQHKLIAAATVPGSDIIKLQSVPANNANRLAALRSPDNQLTFMAAHYTPNARTMTVDALTPGKVFYMYLWNENGDGKNTFERTVTVDQWGRLAFSVGTEEMAVLTEVQLSDTVLE